MLYGSDLARLEEEELGRGCAVIVVRVQDKDWEVSKGLSCAVCVVDWKSK